MWPGFLMLYMKKIEINTTHKTLLADIYTPVGIYLRLRDRFRDTILLESSDAHVSENSFSFIGINAVAGIEIRDGQTLEYKLPGLPPEKITIRKPGEVSMLLQQFLGSFAISEQLPAPLNVAQGVFGYTSYEAVQFFDSFQPAPATAATIPLMRYRLYQYVIAIDHFRDLLYICENRINGLPGDIHTVENIIRHKDVPVFPFFPQGAESSTVTDEGYREMVQKGIAACLRGDVFQMVLSRRFEQAFTGDEFTVYRALRSINPSPYLFYFDYGDYKLMGSSPESQLIVSNGQAIVHPIAGTVKRTGDDEKDKQLAASLEADPKENAEHVMLVDLARNDLSRLCKQVTVSAYKKIQYYSHVIHLVSEVKGTVPEAVNPFSLLGACFPAGTLSGAPKVRAMQLISEYEGSQRGYYGGAIGYIGFNGDINHAIMIRSFCSRNNRLLYQAGAGIVAASVPENELQEVNNKLGALKKAIQLAATVV